MSNNLLHYYQQELAFIRRLSAEFAETHPKIAGRLRLKNKSAEDPHADRLIESFALLTARLRHKIDDDFPEIIDALLSIIYPHYQSPIPAMAIIQLQPDEKLLRFGYEIPRQTLFATNPMHGETCYFQSCYPVTLWPIAVTDARLISGNLLPSSFSTVNTAACLHLTLTMTTPDISYAELSIKELQFFLNLEPPYLYEIYELLFCHTLQIAVANSEQDADPTWLSSDHLQQTGFFKNENLLPYPPRSSIVYQILTEYFAFPEKFYFFKLINLNKINWKKFPNNIHIYCYLSKKNQLLEKYINAGNFLLGCTPAVNLFKQSAEPISLTHTDTEYLLIPDTHRPTNTIDVYQIQQVTAINDQGSEIELLSLYGVNHNWQEKAYYWYAKRKPSWYGDHYHSSGSNLFLSFTDLAVEQQINSNWTIHIETLCSNADLPSQLTHSHDEPILSRVGQSNELIKKINCLTPFTTSKQTCLSDQVRWQLISHLSLNYLSLTEDNRGLDALKEILRLYNFDKTEETETIINSLLSLKTKRITIRTFNAKENAFLAGYEISLTVKKENFLDNSLFLFGSVLDRFFALYVSINSFTKLIICNKDHEVYYQWPARSGEITLL